MVSDHGGIYLDGDEIPLQSFDNFRTSEFTMGRSAEDVVGNGIIVSFQIIVEHICI